MLMTDDYMGRLMKAVAEAGIEDNTLIIFTSDNGCSPEADFKVLAEKGHHPNGIYRGHKADIYEGGHRVPFIAKWPGTIKPASKSDETICTTDLMATVAAITGYHLQDDEGEDSYSLLPVLTGKSLSTTLREATVHHSINGQFAIRQGDWKLAMCGGSGGWSYPNKKAVLDTLPPMQLFNLREDPKESRNLIERYPEKVEELKALLTQYVTEGRSTPGAPQKNDGPESWKQLWWINNAER